SVPDAPFFDTVRIRPASEPDAILATARERGINLRADGDGIIVALDETVGTADLAALLELFGGRGSDADRLLADADPAFEGRLERSSSFMTQPVFHRHRSETEMLRYLHRLQAKDLSLTTSMIPLGSCTMKLNAT